MAKTAAAPKQPWSAGGIPNLAPAGRSGPDKTVAIWRIVMGQQK